MSNEQVPTDKCEACGSTNPQDIDPWANDGYSTCCNELIVSGDEGNSWGIR